MGRRNRRGGQQVERLLAQPELPSAGGERAVGSRDRPGRADGAARRNLEVARVDALLVDRQLGPPERPDNLRVWVERIQREAETSLFASLSPDEACALGEIIRKLSPGCSGLGE